jgi:hypothetical protein
VRVLLLWMPRLPGRAAGPLAPGAACARRVSWYFLLRRLSNSAPHVIRQRPRSGLPSSSARGCKPEEQLSREAGLPYDQWRVRELLPEGFSLPRCVPRLEHSSFPGYTPHDQQRPSA